MFPVRLLVLCCLFGAIHSAIIGKREAESAGEEGEDDRKKREAEEAESRDKRSPRSRYRGLGERQVSTNCRTIVAWGVNDPVACSRISLGDLINFDAVASPGWGSEVGYDPYGGPYQQYPGDVNPHLLNHYGDVDLKRMPGRCRYDPYRHRVDPNSACLCVATRDTCEHGRDGCFWHEDKRTGYKECISKAEKFYNMLYELLKRRGKKSFAIKIRYGATGARGELPYGPYGPAYIGMGNPNQSRTFGVYGGGGHGYTTRNKYGGAEYGGGHGSKYGGGGGSSSSFGGGYTK